jgi:hypothetical protein
MPIAVYFTCAAGTRYRVYDCTFSNYKHQIRPIGDPAATYRIFVPNGGMRRAYKFKKGDARILAEQTLEQQLRETEFVENERFDAVAHSRGAGQMPGTSKAEPR